MPSTLLTLAVQGIAVFLPVRALRSRADQEAPPHPTPQLPLAEDAIAPLEDCIARPGAGPKDLSPAMPELATDPRSFVFHDQGRDPDHTVRKYDRGCDPDRRMGHCDQDRP